VTTTTKAAVASDAISDSESEDDERRENIVNIVQKVGDKVDEDNAGQT
jgi:hypothetical protein